ncbi:hypothetical protein DCAR_0414933 [Daucus carota subsp. sativus]|uniref:Uncharacterized protein n=1 Tax=Daucus carota subsp. sativus TaxID=79200 RepID=A0A165A3U6_DAUCS|nr:hypothetical protein DCAR_0414933 [Daucus carota subsp. sativus]
MKVNILVLVIVLFPAAYNNANLGGLHGSRGNSGNPSDLLLITPSGGTVFDMNAQATPTERPSLSNLTNQSLRPSGINSVFPYV